jgi:hypothetical protein
MSAASSTPRASSKPARNAKPASSRRRTRSGRGRGNPQHCPQAGIHRPERRNRRRIPPHLLALRLPRTSRWRRKLLGRGDRRRAVQGSAAETQAYARRGRDRPFRSPDAVALQLPEKPFEGRAEDDHPLAHHALLPQSTSPFSSGGGPALAAPGGRTRGRPISSHQPSCRTAAFPVAPAAARSYAI